MGPVSQIRNYWSDERLSDLAVELFDKHQYADGTPVEFPTALWKATSEPDTPLVERAALHGAVHLAALDRVPKWSPKNESWLSLTSDNSEVLSYEISSDGKVRTHHPEGPRQSIVGRSIQEDRFRVLASPDIATPRDFVDIEVHLLECVYAALVPDRPKLGDWGNPFRETAPLFESIIWMSRAMRSSNALDYDTRLVQLRIAFEALTQEGNSRRAVATLRGLLEANPPAFATALRWSPEERPFIRHPVLQDRVLTPLEHWFASFSSARNAIVHFHATDRRLAYESDTNYAGPLLPIAFEVLRDAIKAHLTARGFAAW